MLVLRGVCPAAKAQIRNFSEYGKGGARGRKPGQGLAGERFR